MLAATKCPAQSGGTDIYGGSRLFQAIVFFNLFAVKVKLNYRFRLCYSHGSLSPCISTEINAVRSNPLFKKVAFSTFVFAF